MITPTQIAGASSPDLNRLPAHKPILLKNVTCVYCGQGFGPERRATKEHVIGRNFVPRGSLDGQWNLIVRACERCNGMKAELENDISAITMQPDSAGQYAADHPLLLAEAARKAQGAFSRRSRKLVKHSAERITLRGRMGPATVTFNLHAAPQVDEHRAAALAHMQLRAFFYWITFNSDTGRGGFWTGKGDLLVAHCSRHDWGNPLMRAFMPIIENWDPRVFAIGADGFFKLRISRRLGGPVAWAWGIEWNLNHRLIGFFGDEVAIRGITSNLPSLAMHHIVEAPNRYVRYRLEVPLAEDEDFLFARSRAATSVAEPIPSIVASASR